MTANIVPIFRAAGELHKTLGILYDALNKRDVMTVQDQLQQLARGARTDEQTMNAIRDTLQAVKLHFSPYDALECARTVFDKSGKNATLKQISLDVLLDATLQIANDDAVLAVENLASALRKIETGTLQEHQITDQIAHICLSPDPVEAPQLLALVMEANNVAYENRNSEHALHQSILTLAGTVESRKPIEALDAYGCIMEDMYGSGKAIPDDLAKKMVDLCRIIAPRDKSVAQEGLETILDNMPSANPAFQEATILKARLDIEDKPHDYQQSPSMTPAEFSKFTKPTPFS